MCNKCVQMRNRFHIAGEERTVFLKKKRVDSSRGRTFIAACRSNYEFQMVRVKKVFCHVWQTKGSFLSRS